MCAGCASMMSVVRICVALATHHASEGGVGDIDFDHDFEPPADWLASPNLSASSSSGATSGSSSSSSSSSESDSSGSSGEDPTAAVGERAAAAEVAEPERASRRRGRPAEPARPDMNVKRHRRDETFEWRNFRFTFRPGTDARKPGYMALCRFHSAAENTKCTRTATWNDESERAATVRKLKTWCVKAGDYHDRREHQAHVTAEVLSDDALEAAELPPLPGPGD